MSKLASIRNPEGIWINTQVFREEGVNFMKYKRYISDPWGSSAWYEYWGEQRDRCMNGYTVGGAKITGDHYRYMNFNPIKKVADTTRSRSTKIVGFPDFWDGDYNYFWVREIAKHGILDCTVEGEEEREAVLKLPSIEQATELKILFESLFLEVKIKVDYLHGGFNLIVGKSRRKGYSYKSASIAANNFFTKPKSYTIFGAYEKKYLYPKGLFTMAKDSINFINEHTAWAMPSDFVNQQAHIRASYSETKNGIILEKGFLSEIQALTFKDNPDAARGKDAEDIFFEESGAFGTPNLLKQSYSASQDCVMAGAIKTGLITIFGTSGDMEGGTADYADMHSRPAAFGLLPFQNIWDEDAEDRVCGFFHPIFWNMEGFYDKQGNSDKKGAIAAEMKEREDLVHVGASSEELQRRMQEKPLGPSEAFGMMSNNNFPVVELRRRLELVKGKGLQQKHGMPVEFYREKGIVYAKPILDGTANPIQSFLTPPVSKYGCPVIYEQPIEGAPKGLYKIGYDPVRQNQGSSLAGIIVYKSKLVGSVHHNIVVAEYIGRLRITDDIDAMAEYFAEYYGTTIMHENEVPGVINYFRKIKKLFLLAAQPDAVISKNIKKSVVARIWGCHMNTQLKGTGERYTKDWLLTTLDYDENGDPITVIDKIDSIRLLEELINYDGETNTDLVSALFMCLIQVQEHDLQKEYNKKTSNSRSKQLAKLAEIMHKKF